MIKEPGVYDGIDIEAYHGDPKLLDGPSISGSGLALIERRCAAVYWAQSPLNPDRFPPKESDALNVGRAAHAIILEGEEAFRKAVSIKPEDFNGRTKAGRAWVAEREELGLTIISFDQWRMILAMVRALAQHPEAARAFKDGIPERSMFWKDEVTGVWLRSRPDWWPNSGRFFPNYKTANSVKGADFEKQAHNLGYHQSAALVMEGARLAAGIPDALPYLVAQEKEPPFIVEIYPFEEEALQWAAILNRRAIDIFAKGIETGEWPKYNRTIKAIRMPGWMEHSLQERHAEGEFQAPPEEQYQDVRNILAGA